MMGGGKRSLKQLLENGDVEMLDASSEANSPTGSQGEDHKPPLGDRDGTPAPAPGFCVECTDTPEEVYCEQCAEPFCQLCFDHLHRTGNRRKHSTKRLKVDPRAAPQEKGQPCSDEEEPEAELDAEDLPSESRPFTLNTKFIPMRLTASERRYFRLLEAALRVSEYTDKVDVFGHSSRSKRILAQLREMCTILTGLVVAHNMEEGQALVAEKDFAKNAAWFKQVFEIGRRYKIMNPERMRDTFGKLMYMIMDSRLPEISEQLDFDLYAPIKTVHALLEHYNCLELLEDPLVGTATQEIVAGNRPRREVQRQIRQKENAVEHLARKYSKKLHSEYIRQVLYSIGDYHAYVQSNRAPVQSMIKLLVDNFVPDSDNKSDQVLGIRYGLSGARLSHDHRKQYQYVLQSLTLWSEIMRDMYMLWKLADDDMCSETRYQLSNTGQGLNRVKPCPKVGRAMYNIISNAQRKTGSWIGSSVVHLGDHAVPNALFFLDKYLQVPRILNPVYLVLERLHELVNDKYVAQYVDSQFHSLKGLEKTVLVDFFRHAFDGSGADNFYDAGSCIDGRLTSAWNWANGIAKKPYYHCFLLSGFTGFDGSEGF